MSDMETKEVGFIMAVCTIILQLCYMGASLRQGGLSTKAGKRLADDAALGPKDLTEEDIKEAEEGLARWGRISGNMQENIFLGIPIMWIQLFSGCDELTSALIMIFYTVFRVGHMIFYIVGINAPVPVRSLCFLGGKMCEFAAMISVAKTYAEMS